MTAGFGGLGGSGIGVRVAGVGEGSGEESGMGIGAVSAFRSPWLASFARFEGFRVRFGHEGPARGGS
jgi:hypothetical protein